jgi:hypothetical protein
MTMATQHRREEPGQPDENRAIDVSQSGALWRLAPQNQRLLAQDEISASREPRAASTDSSAHKTRVSKPKRCAFDYQTRRASSRGWRFDEDKTLRSGYFLADGLEHPL